MKRFLIALLGLILLCSIAWAEEEMPARSSSGQLPLLFLTGDTVLMTKHNAVAMQADLYLDDWAFHGFATVKWQGTSSLGYPKKNFTIKLFQDEDLLQKAKLDFGWGAEDKYCLKANYIDHSHARNIVSARLWGEVVRSRAGFDTLPQELKDSPNMGAIDGFPVRLYINGEYEGLYTWNIPKDAWMFNMDDTLDTHTVLCGENFGSGCFQEPAKIDGSDWSDEVHDVVPESVVVRWNEVIDFVRTSTDEAFMAQIDSYIDKESLIDYYLFAYMSCGLDSMGKNQIYCTYDGQKWYASMYDMDSTWGLHYSGNSFVSPEYRCQEDYESSTAGRTGNLLYQRVEQLFVPEIKARYAELRRTVLSDANMLYHFESFMSDIPAEVYAADLEKYPDIPSAQENNIYQLRSFITARSAYMDFMIEHLGEDVTYQKADPNAELYSCNGSDSLGEYAFKLNQPLTRSSYLLDTGFMPFDTEKDWTIYCKFADSMVPEDGAIATIFEMRQYFSDADKHTAVYLRRAEKDGKFVYQMGSGFGGFDFPFENAPGYKEPTDGYHQVVIIKEGRQFKFYLDGGLAYNCPLDYGVDPAQFSTNTLYLFGRVENGITLNRAFGEIADFRIYTSAIPYSSFTDFDTFDRDGRDEYGSYVLKTKAALVSDGQLINTGFKPYDVEKDWTILCKFSDTMDLMDISNTGSIFEMRQHFPEDQVQTALFCRMKLKDGVTQFSFAGGFGSLSFPYDKSEGYAASTDGYHYVAVMKNGPDYWFYLDGGLAYNCAMNYRINEMNFSQESLYLFGRYEAGYEHDQVAGEIADLRIYDTAIGPDAILEIFESMQ